MNSIRLVHQSPVDPDCLEQYARVPIAFWVNSRLVVQPVQNGLGGLLLHEEPVTPAYLKDYDAIAGECPIHWRDHFDLSHWTVLSAFAADRQVGGAVIAWNTPSVDMLEGRGDLAVLWDVRVHPEYRGHGVGHRLFTAATDWARTRGCRTLKIETQNINVPACRFYARQGCELRTIRSDAYADLPEEVQLLWYKSL